MQPLILQHDSLHISLGERRKKSDLGRFSLDLSSARELPESFRSRAYPSPPMSGSPPLPPRLNLDSSDRGHGHGSYFSAGGPNCGYRDLHNPQHEHLDHRGLLQRSYLQPSDPVAPMTLPGPYRSEHIPPLQTLSGGLQTLSQLSQSHHQPHPEYLSQSTRPPTSFSTAGPSPIREQSGFNSLKQQRKTKGHVASACVPCKRAHLRCDAQRPCSRCVSNGKEDACVDVQHKKRGRPRLRDEKESRYEGTSSAYPAVDLMRRPLPLYGLNQPSGPGFSTSIPLRRGEYRVLKSHGSSNNHIPSRYLDHASMVSANVLGPTQLQTPRSHSTPEPSYALLNMDMSIVKATVSFGETIGLQSITNRLLQDVVSPNDREKVFRLQRSFEEERREREPNFLPPIYLAKFEEDRIIQTIGFGPEDLGQLGADRQEMLTFEAPDGQQRTFQVRFGLAQRNSTYFILVLLSVPSIPIAYHSPSSPYTRESNSRDSQYGYQTSLQGYHQNPSTMSFTAGSGNGIARMELNNYRTPGFMGPTMSYAPTGVSTYSQPQARTDFSQPQTSHQVPRSVLSQSSQPRPNDLQLPPIRGAQQQRDGGKSRLDIGGLCEGLRPVNGWSRGPPQ